MTAEKRREYEEDLKKLRPIDDIFMREIFRNNIPLIQLVLRIITGISDLVITEEITQYDMKRLLGARSLCLDVLGKDSLNRIYNLEIERSKDGAKPKRARYHSSSMDIEFLDKNQDFDELPATYTIFITEKDLYGKGKPIYRIERINTTINEPFNDDEHILYVNGAYENEQDNSDIAKLLHDFRCSDAGDMYIDLMANSTRCFKEKSKEADRMCDVIDQIVQRKLKDSNVVDEIVQSKLNDNDVINQIVQRKLKDSNVVDEIVQSKLTKAIEENEYKKNCEFAVYMLKKGMPLNEIVEVSKLSIEKVKELSFQLSK